MTDTSDNGTHYLILVKVKVYSYASRTIFMKVLGNNNMRHGKGRIIQPDGDIYEGDWVNDKMHGRGTYHYTDGLKYI